MSKQNTEQFCVWRDGLREGRVYNELFRFYGTVAEAEQYAADHGFGGGIHVYPPRLKRDARRHAEEIEFVDGLCEDDA